MKILATFSLAVTLLVSAGTAQTPGTFTSFGTGCGDANNPIPLLTCPVPPEINKVMHCVVTNLFPGRTGLVIAGESNTVWQAVNLTLPVNLGFLGAPNCTLYTSGECLIRCTTGRGTADVKIHTPNSTNLIGKKFWMQFWAPDPGANAVGIQMSNAGEVTIGG